MHLDVAFTVCSMGAQNRKIHYLPHVAGEGEVDWGKISAQLVTLAYLSSYKCDCHHFIDQESGSFRILPKGLVQPSENDVEYGWWLKMDDSWWEWLKMQPYWQIATFGNVPSCVFLNLYDCVKAATVRRVCASAEVGWNVVSMSDLLTISLPLIGKKGPIDRDNLTH